MYKTHFKATQIMISLENKSDYLKARTMKHKQMNSLTSQRNNPEYLQNKIEHFISVTI